jgi:hypothetical protein
VTKTPDKLNSSIQGSAADGLKATMALMYERRGEVPGVVPTLTVHDEIVLEAPRASSQQALEWLVRCTKDGMGPLLRDIEPVFEAQARATWWRDDVLSGPFGRWVRFPGEQGLVYVAEAAFGQGYYTWCDTPHGRTAGPYLDPTAAIQAGLQRAARRTADEEVDRDTPITAAAGTAALSSASSAPCARTCTSVRGKLSRRRLATRVK